MYLTGIIRIFFVILVLRVVIRSVLLFNHYSKVEENQRSHTVEREAEPEKPVEEVVQMVRDEMCDTIIPKEDAYIIVDDDQNRHYFCSWECRQKYIELRS